MNKGHALGIRSHRQSSLFLSELRKRGHVEFMSREYDGLDVVCVMYLCKVCRKPIERRHVSNHFRCDDMHYEIGYQIVESLVNEGEMELQTNVYAESPMNAEK